MFSKRKAKPELQMSARKVKKAEQSFAPPAKKGRSAPSIISADMQIKGAIHSDGEVQLDGQMEGNVRSASLTIGEAALMNGDITANDVSIRGRVQGNIRARTVRLTGTAHVKGDIFQHTLAVEPGAVVDGRCKHVDDPLSGSAGKRGQASSENAMFDDDVMAR